jgi:hypothetical protein
LAKENDYLRQQNKILRSKLGTVWQNLTMRMQMRWFTRLTNAFSKKIENHDATIALHHMHYNFCRIHQTLRVTPAMEVGITDHVWSLEEIVLLIQRAIG